MITYGTMCGNHTSYQNIIAIASHGSRRKSEKHNPPVNIKNRRKCEGWRTKVRVVCEIVLVASGVCAGVNASVGTEVRLRGFRSPPICLGRGDGPMPERVPSIYVYRMSCRRPAPFPAGKSRARDPSLPPPASWYRADFCLFVLIAR